MEDGGSGSRSEAEGGSGPRLEGTRVLVVENATDTRDLLAELLSRAGATVTVVASASEAMRALDEQVPDVLISDVAMPGEDGYALMRRVRRRPVQRGGHVPAIAVTAYTSPSDRFKALDAGFHVHLAKPVEPTELIAWVARLANPGAPDHGSA